MTEKVDPRIERTKDMIRSALFALIEEKGFEAVTVRDITTKAGLNRGTFYLHYQDKYDLLEKCKDEVWQGYEAKIRHADPTLLFYYAERGEAYPYLIDVFRFFGEHSSFFRVMMGPKGDPSFILRYKNKLRMHLQQKLIELQPDEQHLLVPRQFLTAYISSANIGIVQDWLESGMPHTPEEMALLISRITRLGPLQMTGALGQSKKPGSS
ncbi:TetR/AcrR family transcriptional regulator [Paenibacillus silvisoli]|uniref:TetR/AcrR family transcriptional regulator n=1 Tax=Paenibacillus silvisoli TaxID=3110539 RepID=UPI002805DEC7|nr:TetR/AcrR family transcriptional regulator [Paenibacillus silvisoli]